ncbi:MAG: prepilin-type N-terminal cleavage/methylation domain-containing protein [Verrucomicrobia bacterium]|nr:prepilin-type N-terminal cleavage/methylation domain-containing protein [Verrucomicrobiota bacterium]
MKTKNQTLPVHTRAFTLIELLVVIAIIAILAAITFPTVAAVKRKQTISKAEAEREQVITAIELYKAELGHYPPDNARNPLQYANNPLYYELMGTLLNGANYETKDGSAQISAANVQVEFGRGGFVNCTRNSDADSSKPAKKFLIEFRSTQRGDKPNGVRLLTCSVIWPANLGNGVAGVPELNPWRYNITNPTNNPGGFDLWVDVYVAGKTNRISNWNKKPQIVF